MRGAVRLALVAACLVLVGCAGLPPRGEPEPSLALGDAGDSPLGRIVADSGLAPGAEASGFRLLPIGESAFAARVALAERAVRSIDAQYYHVHADAAGAAFLRSLRDAAVRGARVRLLVDDFYTGAIEDLLLGLAAHPRVQVRLFNPLPVRQGPPLVRLLLSGREFDRVNHRMHNKLFIADGALAIYGGRNVGDEYFMRHGEANFVDLDVLSAGAVVRELANAFDLYWNSEHVYPLETILPPRGNAEAERETFDRLVREAQADARGEPARDVLRQTPVAAQLSEGRLQLHFGTARAIPDPPSKVSTSRKSNQPSAAMRSQLDAIAAAQSSVVISSPYFIPTEFGMGVMTEALRRGIQVLVLTNSIGSTDEPLAHWGYSRYRPELLRMGVELFELGPTLAREAGGFGKFGASIARLHAKLALVDFRWLLVGSVNLDSRSALYNTELAVAIECPPVAHQVLRVLAGDAFRSMYRLQLSSNGRTIEWVYTGADGRQTITDEEPEHHWLRRMQLWLQSLVVSEDLL